MTPHLSSFPRMARIVAISSVVLLLSAVPASALTILGPWRVTTQTSAGAPVPVATPDLFPSIASLRVNMGRNAIAGATAHVTALRRFRISATESPVVRVGFAFRTLLRNASADVQVALIGRTTGATSRIDLPRANIYIPFATGTANLTRFYDRTLTPGEYDLSVRITYRSRQDSFWDNRRAGSGSPHTFSLVSL